MHRIFFLQCIATVQWIHVDFMRLQERSKKHKHSSRFSNQDQATLSVESRTGLCVSLTTQVFKMFCGLVM